jgi:hypothetical protein
MATVGKTGGGGGQTHEGPVSRAREIAARGDAPSVANLGELVHAGITDVLLGGLDRRDASVTFSGVRTFVGLARNREPVDGLCQEMAEAAESRKAARVAELRAELAALESGDEVARAAKNGHAA